jgi:Fe-S cluster assembly iron-binding protein IscA
VWVDKTLKEANMFQITEKANDKIQEFFEDREEAAIIRIFLSQGG